MIAETTSLWVPFAAAGGALVGAFLNGTVTALGWRRSRQHTHEQWLRDRRATAYHEALTVTYEVGEWAAHVHPFISGGPEPDLPPGAKQLAAWAGVDIFGSPRARTALEEWKFVMQSVRLEAQRITNGDGDRRKLDKELRPEILRTRRKLADVINEELGASVES